MTQEQIITTLLAKLNIATSQTTAALFAQVKLDAWSSFISDIAIMVASILVVYFWRRFCKKKIKNGACKEEWNCACVAICIIFSIIFISTAVCFFIDSYWLVTAYYNPTYYIIHMLKDVMSGC